MIISEGSQSVDLTGCCDYDREASIVSPKLADRAAVGGIGKMSAIQLVSLCVALKSCLNAQVFEFSCAWVVPRTVFNFLLAGWNS